MAAQKFHTTPGYENVPTFDARHKLREELLAKNDTFVQDLPKVELHVHIEGTLSPELRWKLAQRNGVPLRFKSEGPEITSYEALLQAFNSITPRPGMGGVASETVFFFEAYYEGFQVLKTKQDFFDLAMNYFERAAAMNVRYCEPFFDPQGHTSRGVKWQDMMDGFREAQRKAEKELNVSGSSSPFFL